METLRSQLEVGDPDPEILEELAKTVPLLDSQQVMTLRSQLLEPLIALNDKAPADLVVALLKDTSLDEALSYAPQVTLSGTTEKDNVVLRLLAEKVQQNDVGSHAQFIQSAMALAAKSDTSLSALAHIESMAKKLAHWHCLERFVPVRELHEGSSELKSRLMRFNLLLAENNDMPYEYAQKWATWSFDESDVLFNVLLIDYIAQLICFLPSAKLKPLEPLLYQIAQRSNHDDTLLENPIESVLVNLARYHVPLFMVLDSQYSLITADRISMIARLPPGYLAEHHPTIIEHLELSERTLPAFCNLATDTHGYQLLDMPAAKVNRLITESKLQLCLAASSNTDVAPVFCTRYPSVLDTLTNFTPTTLESAALLDQLKRQLRAVGIRLTKPPNVTAAASS